MNEVLETVRFLKSDVTSLRDDLSGLSKDVSFLKENMVSKNDLRQEILASEKRTEIKLNSLEDRLEKKIIFGVAELLEQNILPQLDSMSNRIDSMSNNMDIMSTDVTLIKTALQRPILHY